MNLANSAKNLIVDVKDIRKYFGKVKAVDGIDLEIMPGEFIALLGPNGAGKTTLVEMIEGIQQPDSGIIKISGKSWKRNRYELQQLLGISLQETRFIDKLTVVEILNLFASFYHLDSERVWNVLQIINLQEKKKSYVVNLSGGQRQRLALGIALLNKPQILLLDEPTTGLDPGARREIWKILLELKKEENTSMILTTHYMEEAEFLCDRIIIMDRGKVLAKGTLEELLELNKSHEFVEILVDRSISESDLPGGSGIQDIDLSEDGRKISLKVDNIVALLPKIQSQFSKQKITMETFECRKMTLDDLFIEMTGRHLEA